MPSKGYRKGISDSKEPATRFARTRLPLRIWTAIQEEAAKRSMTFSALLRAIAEAHATGQRAELPHPQGANADAIHDLGRIGNNVNQVAKEAHTLGLYHIEQKALECLDALQAALKRL
ncbi:MAG: plasmid mobilization relaxosome protein MobC [Candidatus Competibacter sp.]|nr:plasmid mobilization relaxosome protein MobC [Candidatus Competibacter sp.]